jgi:hypothetical protein
MTAVQRVIGDFLTQTLLLGSTSHTDKSLTIAKMWAFSNGLQVHNVRASIKTFTPSYWYRRTTSSLGRSQAQPSPVVLPEPFSPTAGDSLRNGDQ